MASKEFIYLQGFAQGSGFIHLLSALNAAQLLHKGQTRKAGGEYIDHPIRVTSGLVLLGIRDETTLCVAACHDTIEDCNVDETELQKRFGLTREITTAIRLVSKHKGLDTNTYFERISSCPAATLVKIADRCHNIGTMAGAFTEKGMHYYIEETERYIIPLCKNGRRMFPQYSQQIVYMKYQLETMVDTIRAIVKKPTE